MSEKENFKLENEDDEIDNLESELLLDVISNFLNMQTLPQNSVQFNCK